MLPDEPGVDVTPPDTDPADDTILTGDDSESDNGKPTDDDKPTDGDKPDGDKTADTDDSDSSEGGDDTADGSPDTYADFNLPEGVELDVALLEAAAPVFKELGLTQDQAQKLIDFQAVQVQAGEVSRVDEFNQLKQDWVDAAKADKDFGGDAFDENIALAKSAVVNFGTPELSALLNDFGIGNHPEMIRFMVKVGKLTKEDNPGGQDHSTGATKDRAELLYPSDD